MKTIMPSAEHLARELDALGRHLPARVINRLEHRRKQVIYHPGAMRHHRSMLSLSGHWLYQHPIMAGSLLLALLLGGSGAYQLNLNRAPAVGDVDACLLGSDLPPGAFTNPQFTQWLQEHAQQ